ncbi:MAG TPA: hypothetical protein VEY50_11280 [Lysobacter sp.]|nr:hypothetical protein [Lysobacter sp.]
MDSTIQLHEANSGQIDSWAPPFMSALLAWLGSSSVATALFVLLNTAATYGAFWLSARAQTASWPWWRLPLALLLIANPVVFAYVGIVWKDVLLASLCVLALGLTVAASRAETASVRIALAGLALMVLLPIPMVRQQGVLLMPVFALSPAILIAESAAPDKRKWVLAGVAVAVVTGHLLLRMAVAATFVQGPDGRDMSVGARIIRSYDLAGIQARTGADGPLARAGAPVEVVTAVQHAYGGDRVDHLSANTAIGNYFSQIDDASLKAMWWDAIQHHPFAYARHRLSAFAWLLGLRDPQRCLPVLVGVDGIPEFLRESRLRAENDPRDDWLYEKYKRLFGAPLWQHWFYVLLLAITLVTAWCQGPRVRRLLLPWIVGLGLFVGAFLPTSIACDFRYLYLLIPCLTAIALTLLVPSEQGQRPASD